MNHQFIATQAREHISDMQRAAAQERLARSAAPHGDGLLVRLVQRLRAALGGPVKAAPAPRSRLIRNEGVTRQ